MTKLTITMPNADVHVMTLSGDADKVAAQILQIKSECPGATFEEVEVEE